MNSGIVSAMRISLYSASSFLPGGSPDSGKLLDVAAGPVWCTIPVLDRHIRDGVSGVELWLQAPHHVSCEYLHVVAMPDLCACGGCAQGRLTLSSVSRAPYFSWDVVIAKFEDYVNADPHPAQSNTFCQHRAASQYLYYSLMCPLPPRANQSLCCAGGRDQASIYRTGT